MTHDEARDAVQAALGVVAPDIDLDEVEGRSRLRQYLELDSLDFLRLVETLDVQTGVNIPESDYPKVGTVDGLVDYLASGGAGDR